MIRSFSLLALCGCLFLAVSCSKRERSDPNAEEWADIQATADDAAVASAAEKSQPAAASGELELPGEFEGFAQRLEQMKSAQRQAGQTLLTGKTLVFDYQEHVVRMDGDVKVVDDRGRLETESLTGRFSASNQVEFIETKGGVSIVSGERKAKAEGAVYNYLNGTVQLDGHAAVAEGGNRLSGERIRFWIKGDRRMVCEPNAVLVVSGASGTGFGGGVPEGGEDTEIRANKIVYDESKHRADLTGQVRLRDARAAMDCGEVRLFLKDDNKIDWIEAVSGVIIQTDDRKALADRATYHANEEKFTLEGTPMVMQGRHVMTGDRIMFWQDTRRMVCEPNARVLLYLDEETRAKFLKDLND